MAYGKLINGEDYVSLKAYNRGGRELFYVLKEIDLGEDRIVEEGFVTDFGSIPRIADKLLGINTREGSLSYLTHDYNYRRHNKSRARADLELRLDQKREGVGAAERAVVFWSLRLFGFPAYNQWKN